MSDQLGPKARALLQATRFAEDATEADADRVRAAVLARVAVGTIAAAGAATAGAATAAAGAKPGALASIVGGATSTSAAKSALGALSVLSVKVLACAGVVTVLGVGAALGFRAMHDAQSGRGTAEGSPALAVPEVRVPASQTTQSQTAQSQTAQGPVVPAAAPVTPPLSSSQAAASSEARAPARALADGPPPGATLPATPSLGSSPGVTTPLDAEIAILREARQALREGRGARALALLDEYARHFPHGVLAEDCAAERVFALCALGSVEQARAQGVQFLANHGLSPHADAVRSSCGLAPAK